MPRVRPFFSNLKLLSSCSSTCSWSLHVAHDDSTAATDVRTSLQVRLLQCAVNGRPEEENQPFGNCGKDIADYEPDQGKAAQRGALQLRSSGHINARTSISECGWLAFRHRIFFSLLASCKFLPRPDRLAYFDSLAVLKLEVPSGPCTDNEITCPSTLHLTHLPYSHFTTLQAGHAPTHTSMASSSTNQWTLLLVLLALFLSIVVTLQFASSFAGAYFAAPIEIITFIDAVDSSVQENESYDRDVSRATRLDDKIRLGRLLREIQKGGDDLREQLNGLLISEEDQRLKTTARLLWRVKRRDLEEKVRRLDMLRMRFLVAYMGMVASGTADKTEKKSTKDPEKIENRLFSDEFAARPQLPRNFTDSIKNRPPLRRLSTQAMGHNDAVAGPHRTGWAGVVRVGLTTPKTSIYKPQILTRICHRNCSCRLCCIRDMLLSRELCLRHLDASQHLNFYLLLSTFYDLTTLCSH